MKKIIVAAFLLYSSIFAQQKLTLQNAVETALKNNFSISIARGQMEIADNNLSPGSAGFLPTLDASGTILRSVTNTTQEYFDGRMVDRNGAVTKNLNASLALNWTVFDGLQMFAELDRLKELKKSGEISFKSAVEQSISSVISEYYNIVRQQQILEVIKKSIALSEERVRIAENKLDVGSGSRFDLRQAKVDLNEDRTNYLREELKLVQAEINLNELLGRDVNEQFQVEDTIVVNKNLNPDDMLSSAMDKNSELLIARENKNLADINLRLARSGWFPAINLTAGYNYTNSEAEAGFMKSNLNIGFNYGVTASWNLFDGLKTATAIQNAAVNIDINKTLLNKTEENIKAVVLTSFKRYENSLVLVELETENLESARENVDIAVERLRLGTLTPLEFRETQKRLLESQSRLLQAQYEAKIAETDLLRLSGELVKKIRGQIPLN
ncbi:MAG: TolC family protein [Ignavibacteriaceae bacterium]|nr:TolC family protein [Ignavibacteriaceae bacterium]